jgi:superfamily I DNA/RNA helicase
MANYYFNLPNLTVPPLTPEQRSAINLPTPIALSGGAGTGKTVVSLYRHLIKIQNGKKCQLLTFTRTLALYLIECCRPKSKSASENISTTFSWINLLHSRDEIIIDEAQDVKFAYQSQRGLTWESKDSNGNTLNRVHIYENVLAGKYSSISYGADNAQMVSDGTTEAELRNIFPRNQQFRLSKNYRNTKKILQLARASFPNANISQQDIDSCINEGEFPVLHVAENKEKDEIIIEIIQEMTGEAHNIAILCSSQNSVKQYFDLVKNDFPDSSFYISKNNGIERISNIHVTTFKSAKGLEFDTVIIPDIHKAFQTMHAGNNITWKDYYVGITRAKSNLYLISENEINQISDFVELNDNESSSSESYVYNPHDDLPF